jgi:DNA-binding transcriptional ArsR family regulator
MRARGSRVDNRANGQAIARTRNPLIRAGGGGYNVSSGGHLLHRRHQIQDGSCIPPATIPLYNHMVAYAGLNDREVNRVFRALADATRRDIVARVLAGEAASVSALAARYEMSFAAVQKHVAVLERAGLVRKRRDGRRRVVSTDMDGLRRARVVLDHYEELWRGRVARMHDLLDEDELPPDPDATPDQETSA